MALSHIWMILVVAQILVRLRRITELHTFEQFFLPPEGPGGASSTSHLAGMATRLSHSSIRVSCCADATLGGQGLRHL
jgi:hypothetical protein